MLGVPLRPLGPMFDVVYYFPRPQSRGINAPQSKLKLYLLTAGHSILVVSL